MTMNYEVQIEQNFTTCHLIDENDCLESLMQDLREHYQAQAPFSANELVLFMPANLGLLIKHTETDVRSMWQHGANKRVSEMRGSI